MVPSVPTITLKNLPRDLHRDLKKRALANHRSLNKELIATLQSATRRIQPLEVAALARQARSMRKKFTREISAAEITRWKRQGRLSIAP